VAKLIPLMHAQELCTSRPAKKPARLTCFLAHAHFSCSSFSHHTECSSCLHKLVQELARICIKIWHKKLAQVFFTSIFSMYRGIKFCETGVEIFDNQSTC